MKSKKYNPKDIESKWYKFWMDQDLFSSTPDAREPYTIVIPPPNITGVLHMGHMLNNTIQDVLIRKARMEGYNACWVPGTDHASIATEAKVVQMLREQGITKSSLTREQFLKYCFEWKDKYGGIILDQLKQLGASCDWNRTRFTMEDTLSKAVTKCFIHLYNKGYIYRDWRIVNWDPKAQTTLSNEEVIRKDTQSNLYYVKYKFTDSDDYCVVATTRPETIMGDTAISINPKDSRTKKLKGKKVLVPIVNREIPIIEDEYVDKDYGTGMLKVTPAHDPNDYNIGKKHNLETIDIFNNDGTLNENAQILIGEDRFIARKKIAKMLEENGSLVKVEKIKNNVGYSERNPNTVVEPKLSLQWYVSMKEMIFPALDAVMQDAISFIPPKYKNVYKHWLENFKDWPISRQLWWGHQIPVWYINNSEEEYVVALNEEEALQKAKIKTKNNALTLEQLTRDEDALDTWFSSWLWPIAVFDGFEEDSEEFNYYYPTNVLVTGWDIIFFWVARMIFAGYEFKNQKPFDKVYFTGMVRDLNRKKMSKSLGNSPDANKLINHYGADGVRFGMLSCAAAGNDLLFDERLCEQGRNFSNKLWNAYRLVESWKPSSNTENDDMVVIEWLENKLNKHINTLLQNMQDFRLSEALINLYSFIWNDFCSSYLEFIKPAYGEPINQTTLEATKTFFNQILILLHPFMPFITEELWQRETPRESICIQEYPSKKSYNNEDIDKGDYARDIISSVREIRNRNGISPKETLNAFVILTDEDNYKSFESVILKIANLKNIQKVIEAPKEAESFIVKGQQFFIEVNNLIDSNTKKKELEKELAYTKGFLASVEKKLSNSRFVQNAPKEVIEKEQQKKKDSIEKIKLLEESLAKI